MLFVRPSRQELLRRSWPHERQNASGYRSGLGIRLDIQEQRMSSLAHYGLINLDLPLSPARPTSLPKVLTAFRTGNNPPLRDFPFVSEMDEKHSRIPWPQRIPPVHVPKSRTSFILSIISATYDSLCRCLSRFLCLFSNAICTLVS